MDDLNESGTVMPFDSEDQVWGEHGRRIRFLHRVELFRESSDAGLANVATALKHLTVQEGQVICREGDAGDDFFIVASGTLLVTADMDGRAVELARLGPGEFFGEMALLGQQRRTATVRAGTEAELWTLSEGEFQELLAREPELERAVRGTAEARTRARSAFEVYHRSLASLLEGRERITIGRDPTDDVVVDSPLASRNHATIERSGDAYRIRDQYSTTGTLVNGSPVKAAELHDGDEIGIGGHRLLFDRTEIREVVELPGIRIDAFNLAKVVKGGKRLLQYASVSVLPGEFVAIVGGSGAGKTTMLDALSGVRPATSGRVLYNGRDFYRSMDAYRSALGYVPQDDIIHTGLPLRKTLLFGAELRLPADATSAERGAAVDRALEELDLTSRAELRVDKLSGGQRKRASIAVELLTDPRVFFLDEPTSGLDPAGDARMMSILRKLADGGHTVVLTTHATKNVMQCDKIVILAPEGHLAFFGSPRRALRYFGTESFDEIYSKLSREKSPEFWGQAFRESEDYQELLDTQPHPDGNEATAQERHPLGSDAMAGGMALRLRQFRALARRNWALKLADRGELMPLIMQPLIMTLLLVALFRSGLFDSGAESAVAPMQLLFILTFLNYLFGLLYSVQEIVTEYPIFHRERMVNVGIAPYIMGKLSLIAPLLVYAGCIMTVLLWLLSRLPDARFAVYPQLVLTLVLTSWVGMGLALFTSAAARTSLGANSVLSLWIMPQVLFAGALFPVPQMATVGRMISTIAPLRWSFEAASHITGLPAFFSESGMVGNALLAQYEQQFARDPVQNWLILVAFIAVGLTATGLVLKRKASSG